MHVWQNIQSFKEMLQTLGGALFNVFASRHYAAFSKVKVLIHQSDIIERDGVLFGQKNDEQIIRFKKFIQSADALIACSPKYLSEKAFLELNLRKWALLYRMEQVNGGLAKDPFNETALLSLKKMALDWKSKNLLKGEHKLTPCEIRALKALTTYRLFLNQTFLDSSFRDALFQWILAYKNPVEPYLEFPATVKKLIKNGLHERIGRRGGEHHLKILMEHAGRCQKKVLTLPFEGRAINILDDRISISFKGGVTTTLKNIFHTFSQKFHSVGDFEFMEGGICNWNAFKWGFWHAEEKQYKLVDLSYDKWWCLLEPFETLTLQEAQKRYGGHLDGVIWNVAVTASRGSASLDLLSNHAFKEIAKPNGDGSYAIYPFGKYATEIPNSFSVTEALPLFAKMLPATVAFPDENVFALRREFARYSIGLTAQQAMDLMHYISVDQQKGRDGHFVYQIQSENCAKWIIESLKKLLPKQEFADIFKIHFLEAEPQGGVKLFFDMIRAFPKKWQWPIMQVLHHMIGAARKKVIVEEGKKITKTLPKTEFWKTGIILLPALLHHKLATGALAKIHSGSAHLSGIIHWLRCCCESRIFKSDAITTTKHLKLYIMFQDILANILPDFGLQQGVRA